MKMADYIGRIVRLKRAARTNGGTEFAEGDLLLVRGHHQGRLHGHDPNDPKRYIRQLNRGAVEVVDAEGVGQ